MMNVPGLKIFAPSTAYDLKGLLKTAIRDNDPVIFFEDLNLSDTTSEIPDEEYVIPMGQAAVRRAGTDVTVVAIAGAVGEALAAAEELAADGVAAEVIDPRTLVPLDREAILNSVRKTGRLVAVDLAHKTCSAASEIAATAAEEAFAYLKAPIVRVVTPDVQIPFSPALEKPLYPNRAKIVEAVRRVLA
jgi:pyruvate dehydrogenase E1 component beta subunit